ncbi:unnamed protein product [Closterium sp. NIES-54]
MAAQELHWLTYLLTDLGEPPRSPPVLYVDNKAMLALCREQRLEHRTKHIALRYFLARELQQRGQLRLAYVASEANTADVFTKALAPCDHQRCCTQLVNPFSFSSSQHRHRVGLHSCSHHLEVLASLRRQRDRWLYYADHRARRLPVSSALTAGVVDALRRRRLLRRLLLLARLCISTWATGGRSTTASLGVVLVAIIAVGTLVGKVVRIMTNPTLPPSTTTSTALVPRRPLFVDVHCRPPTSATTSAWIPALPLLLIQLSRSSVVCLRKELCGMFSLLHRLVLKNIAGDGVLVKGLTRARYHHLPSQDVTFDESVPFYRLFPYRSAPPPPPPLFFAPGPPPIDPLPPQGPAPSGVSQIDPLSGTVPVEVADDSSAARGTASGGAERGGAELGGAEPGGAEREGVEPGGADSEGAESGGAKPRGTASSGGPAGASPRLPELETLPLETLELEVLEILVLEELELLLELVVPEVPQLLVLEVLVPGVLELPGLVVLGALELEELELETLRSVEVLKLEELELETLELLALELEALALVALELEELELETLELLTLELEVLELGVLCLAVLVLEAILLSPPPRQSQPQLQPGSPLSAPSPYSELTESLAECREPESRNASHVRAIRTARRVPRPCPPPVPGTHAMALRPSSVPLRVPLPPPPNSSFPAVPDPESNLAHAASSDVSRLLATIVTNPSFESTAVSALVAELVDFAAA